MRANLLAHHTSSRIHRSRAPFHFLTRSKDSHSPLDALSYHDSHYPLARYLCSLVTAFAQSRPLVESQRRCRRGDKEEYLADVEDALRRRWRG